MSRASELNRALEFSADFHRDRLGDWEPREGHPVAQVDAQWLMGLLDHYRVMVGIRYSIRDLALNVGLKCTIPEFENKDDE